ncbi:MAG TPA: hypothetical protein VM433_11470 [Mycobacteriales bacterium]|nr:hypothetical protein [Mycobacteriales bacterium]
MKIAATCAAAVLVGVAAAAGAGATTAPGSNVLCADDDGRERLTGDASWTFEAPVVTAPELAATRDVTGDSVTTYREAKFPLLVDLAPASTATVDLDLFWKRSSDYDLYVLDGEGSVVAGSDEPNVEDGTTTESIPGLRVKHCDALTVVVRNWAGVVPQQELFLNAAVTPGPARLSCAESDPAPGCAGKAAGQAPDAVVDARTRLYLGGTAGQVSMVSGYSGTPPVTGATLTQQRPTTGTPNSYTRPVAGFRDQLRNPFMPWFEGALAAPRPLVGTADALVWVSSPTLRDGGSLFVDLYADDAVVGSVQVPGEQVGTDPTPLRVAFPGLNIRSASTLTLQLGTTPAVSTNGAGEPGDAVFTVHYGGVQFPSRITLP